MVSKKTPTKKVATKKAPVKKVAKKPVHHAKASTKVDYYPNRMTYAISALAVLTLFLLALIVTLNP